MRGVVWVVAGGLNGCRIGLFHLCELITPELFLDASFDCSHTHFEGCAHHHIAWGVGACPRLHIRKAKLKMRLRCRWVEEYGERETLSEGCVGIATS